MRWGLTGYYGLGNLGDELMLHLLAAEIGRIDSAAVVHVLLAPGGSPDQCEVPPDARVSFHHNSGPRAALGFVGINDVVLWGGGTCLHAGGFCGLHVSLLARARGRPFYWIGVGVDDVGAGLKKRLKARVALALCAGVTYRDPESERVARRLTRRPPRGRVAADLVYLLLDSPLLAAVAAAVAPGRSRSVDAPSPEELIVSWRGFESLGREHLATLAEELQDGAAEIGAGRIRVLSLADSVDAEASRTMFAALEAAAGRGNRGLEVVLEERSTLTEKLRRIAEAKLVFSVRLHGFFVAKLLGIPAVGVAYAPKVERFAARLSQPRTIDPATVRAPGGALRTAIVQEAGSMSALADLDGELTLVARNLDLLREIAAS